MNAIIKHQMIKRLKELSNEQLLIKQIEQILTLDKYNFIINTNTFIDIRYIINCLSIGNICNLLKNGYLLFIINENKLIDCTIDSNSDIVALCLLKMKYNHIEYCRIILSD